MNEEKKDIEESLGRAGSSWPSWAINSIPHGLTRRQELSEKFASWVGHHAKDLWDGVNGLKFDRDEHQVIFGRLLNTANNSSEGRILAKWWCMLVMAGNKLGIWKIFLPAGEVTLPAIPPVFVPMDFQLLQHYRPLEEALIRLACSDLNTDQLKHAVLCSAVFFGGIASSGRLAALSALKSSDITGNKSLLWAMLEIPDGRNATRLIRWYPDSLTGSLIVRLRETGAWTSSLLDVGRPKHRLITAIDNLGLGTWPATWSDNELLRAVQTSLFLEHIGVVAGYLCDQFVSYSLSDTTLHRIAQWKSAENELPSESFKAHESVEGDFVPIHVPVFSPSVTHISQRESLQRIYAVLKNGRDVHAKLSNLQKEIGAEMWPVTHYLIEWAKWRISPATGENGIRPISVLRYLRPLAKTIIYEADDEDLLSLDVEDFEILYELATANIKGSKERAKVWATLRSFHDFLFLCGAPDIDFRELDGYGSDQPSGSVLANLVTEAEFRQFKKIFFQPDKSQSSLASQRLFFAAMLGFRAGLRRREVQMLRMTDFHPGPEPFLVIRPSKFATLKSNSSNRRIPLKALIPTDEFDAFVSFMAQRDLLLGGQPGFIFSEYYSPDTPPSQGKLIDPVTEAFHVICGNGRSNFCFHHLRHSFSNWLFLALLASDQPELIVERPEYLDSELLQGNHIQVIRDTLFPRLPGTPVSPDRRHLYQVAAFMGHLSPLTTLRSYLHVLDWVAVRSLDLSLENKLSDLGATELGRVCGMSASAPYKNPYRDLANQPVRFLREFILSRGKFRKRDAKFTDPCVHLQKIQDLLKVQALPDIRLVMIVIARRIVLENSDSLTRNFAISPDTVEASYRAYMRMYAKQSVKNPKTNVPIPSIPRNRRDQIEFWRILEGTEKAYKIPENRQCLSLAAECLIRRSGPRYGRLYFGKRVIDAPDIARAILLMGIPPDQVKLVLREVPSEEHMSKVIETVVDAIRKIGIGVVTEPLSWQTRSKKSDLLRLDISLGDGLKHRSEGRVRGLNYAALLLTFANNQVDHSS